MVRHSVVEYCSSSVATLRPTVRTALWKLARRGGLPASVWKPPSLCRVNRRVMANSVLFRARNNEERFLVGGAADGGRQREKEARGRADGLSFVGPYSDHFFRYQYSRMASINQFRGDSCSIPNRGYVWCSVPQSNAARSLDCGLHYWNSST